MTEAVRISGSLRNRLVGILILGAAGLALMLFLAIRGYATRIAQQGQDSILRASATSILDTAVIRNGAVEIDIPYASFSMLSTGSDDRIFYAIHQGGLLLSGYPGLPGAADAPEAGAMYRTAVFQDVPVRLVTVARQLIGADERLRVTVTLAQTQDALAGTLRQISRNAALFGSAFFALAAVLSFWAASTTIGQLRRLTQSVARRGPQDLSPFAQPVPSEMLPLVGSLNSLMTRLDQSLRRSEDFIAEAAHRVRTPLATVRSHAEATLQRVDKAENRIALRAMVRAIDESSRAAGQLLDHAMITFRADHLDRSDIDLSEMVRDMVRGLTPVAQMKDLDFSIVCEDPARCNGDAILLQNAIRNVIDNALKYSPAESTVRIAVRAAPRPVVEVCDRGPGFPAEGAEALLARFRRGANAEGTIGSGLGLTIAHEVALAHGGTLTLANRDGGGACVALSL